MAETCKTCGKELYSDGSCPLMCANVSFPAAAKITVSYKAVVASANWIRKNPKFPVFEHNGCREELVEWRQ